MESERNTNTSSKIPCERNQRRKRRRKTNTEKSCDTEVRCRDFASPIKIKNIRELLPIHGESNAT